MSGVRVGVSVPRKKDLTLDQIGELVQRAHRAGIPGNTPLRVLAHGLKNRVHDASFASGDAPAEEPAEASSGGAS